MVATFCPSSGVCVFFFPVKIDWLGLRFREGLDTVNYSF